MLRLLRPNQTPCGVATSKQTATAAVKIPVDPLASNPSLWRLGQDHCRFEASLHYLIRFHLKQTNRAGEIAPRVKCLFVFVPK